MLKLLLVQQVRRNRAELDSARPVGLQAGMQI